MHEMSLFKDLMEKIEAVSQENGGKKIVKIRVLLGALSHLSKDHFRHHFDTFVKGTAAEGSQVDIALDKDKNAPHAQGVVLESVELEI